MLMVDRPLFECRSTKRTDYFGVLLFRLHLLYRQIFIASVFVQENERGVDRAGYHVEGGRPAPLDIDEAGKWTQRRAVLRPVHFTFLLISDRLRGVHAEEGMWVRHA